MTSDELAPILGTSTPATEGRTWRWRCIVSGNDAIPMIGLVCSESMLLRECDVECRVWGARDVWNGVSGGPRTTPSRAGGRR